MGLLEIGKLRAPKLHSLFDFVQSGRLAAAILLTTLLPYAIPADTSAQELPCGVWVVRNALHSRSEWDLALANVERLGCRRVYLQVSGRWDAYYPSAVFPAPAAAPQGWDDPLSLALEEAHARGLEVHAWVNALLAWSAPEPPPDPVHVFRRRPDWFVTGPGGRSMRALSRAELDRMGLTGEGWFLDPARPGVRTELRRFLLELATRYAVDGVHLDYIRYPSAWKPPGGEQEVTRLVELIGADLRAVRPGMVLSAAVMPRPEEALRSFGQDWETWLARGLVDEVVPMVYRDTPNGVVGMVQAYPASVPRERVWVGVRIDRLDPSEYREATRRLAGDGVAGAVLFSHNLIEEEPAWRRAGRIALGGLFDLARPDAARADPDAAYRAADLRAHRLEIGLEAPTRFVVGVAHGVPRHGAFAAGEADFGHRSLRDSGKGLNTERSMKLRDSDRRDKSDRASPPDRSHAAPARV